MENLISKIRTYIGIISLRDWKFSLESNNPIRFNKLDLSVLPIITDKENLIWFKPIFQLHRGWYLLCIRHSGNNRKPFATIYNNSSSYKQGRVISPSRRRWRVIRITNNNSDLSLRFDSVVNPIYINQLLLFPIPSFLAWKKIKYRYKHFYSNVNVKKYPIVFLWKKYNSMLLSQKLNNYSAISYSNWLTSIEKMYISNILKNYNMIFNSTYKIIIKPTIYFDEVEDNSYVLPLASTDSLSEYTIKLYSVI